MKVTIELKPEIEQGLLAQARERSISVDDYVQEIVSNQILGATPRSTPDGKAVKLPLLRLSAEEWATQFDDWADSFPEAPPIPDEALKRENLNRDRF